MKNRAKLTSFLLLIPIWVSLLITPLNAFSNVSQTSSSTQKLVKNKKNRAVKKKKSVYKNKKKLFKKNHQKYKATQTKTISAKQAKYQKDVAQNKLIAQPSLNSTALTPLSVKEISEAAIEKKYVLSPTLTDEDGKEIVKPKITIPSNGKKITLYEVLQYVLAKEPNIMLQKQQIDVAKGARLTADGVFDTTLNAAAGYSKTFLPLQASDKSSLESLGLTATNNITKQPSYTAGVQKQLRSGTVVAANASLIGTESYVQDILGFQPTSRSAINFTVTIPIWKGRGTADATEKAAQLNEDSAIDNLVFVTSQSLNNAILSYLNCLYAEEQLRFAIDTEIRAINLLSAVKRLAEIDEKPLSDVGFAMANYTNARASRVAAETNLRSLRNSLASVIGYQQTNQVLVPTGELLHYDDKIISKYTKYPEQYVKAALAQRTDISAAKKLMAAALLIMNAANNDLKPLLNLGLGTGYAGLKEGSINSVGAFNGMAGPNLQAQVTYQFPVANQAAKGAFLAASAKYQQTLINVYNLERVVTLNVLTDISNFPKFADQIRQSEVSSALYKQQIANETKKMRYGLSTVLDVLNVETKYTAAELQRIALRFNYSQTLLDFQFQTGNLAKKNPDGTFTTILEYLYNLD